MAEISASAYQKIRDYIQANWKYIELQDTSGTPVIRLGIGDARVSWTHAAGAQTVELTVVLSGSDGYALPKTFAKSAIFDVAEGGTALSTETYTTFVMETTLDELTVKHQIQVPQVV